MSGAYESAEGAEPAGPTGLVGLVGPMIEVPAGSIEVRDEGTRRSWLVEVGEFRMAQHPVTRGLYEAVMGAVMGAAPACAGGPRAPVTEVSWLDAVGFCNALSRAMGLTPCYELGDDGEGREASCAWTADGYRLPSEAEWEYACRAGSRSLFFWGDAIPAAPNHEVNALGLAELGNHAELCADGWHASYEGAPTDGRAWAGVGRHPAAACYPWQGCGEWQLLMSALRRPMDPEGDEIDNQVALRPACDLPLTAG